MDSSPRPVPLPKHFYSLDALRGVAALSVVFWHWQHFFFQGTQRVDFDRERQPFYAVFGPFYTDGARAVELFFCLSGFIFFWLYAGPVRRRETSWKEFAALRFSRLYPLHFATLLFVAAGQWLVRSWRGTFFVYPCNDPYHFILHLFFASSWGFQDGYSFNYPVWSVSIEVLCYAVFFVVCFLKSDRWWQLLLFVGMGVVLELSGAQDFGCGVLSFFAGGVAFRLLGAWLRREPGRFALGLLTAFAALAWYAVPFGVHNMPLYNLYRHHYRWLGFTVLGQDAPGLVIGALEYFAFDWLLFPLTILVLALWEVRRGALGRRLAPLGHISYATYLLHFPLQLVFFAVTTALAVPPAWFFSPWSMVLFFAVLVPLSLACYRHFERPCQQWLRARLTPRPARGREQAAAAPLVSA